MLQDNITQEINKIAEEIDSLNQSFQSTLTSKPETRLDNVNIGLLYYELSGLQYSFLRFFSFADPSQLSEKAIKFHAELLKTKNAMKDITENKEIPTELNEFLNKKVDGD